jgi:hypothetical protein
LNSLRAATIRGITALANKGEYTAYLCSAGKYRSASIPGLKNALEAKLKASAEYLNDCERELADAVFNNYKEDKDG